MTAITPLELLIIAVAGKYMTTRWQQRRGSLTQDGMEQDNAQNQCKSVLRWGIFKLLFISCYATPMFSFLGHGCMLYHCWIQSLCSVSRTNQWTQTRAARFSAPSSPRSPSTSSSLTRKIRNSKDIRWVSGQLSILCSHMLSSCDGWELKEMAW